MANQNTFSAADLAAELHTCRAQLAMLLAHAPLATWTTDRELRLISIAGAAVSRAGFDPDSLTGAPLTHLLAEYAAGSEWIAGFLEAHRRALAGDTISLTIHWQGRPWQVRVEPLPGNDGQPAGCMGLAVEITQPAADTSPVQSIPEELTLTLDEAYVELQVQNEELIAQQEELRAVNEALLEAQAQTEAERARLAAVIAHAPAGIVVADAEGRILSTNPAADRLYNQPVPYGQPYESQTQLRLVHPDGTPYNPRDRPLIRAALDGETVYGVEMTVLWPDGQQRELLVNAAPIRSPDGSILGAVILFHDMTEHRQAQEALRENEELLRRRVEEVETLMKVAPVAMWVANDPQCDQIVGNPAANSFYEASQEENVSANVSPLRRFFRDGRELKPQELPMQEAAARNIDIRNTDIDVLLPSGRWLNMLGSASPLRDARGQVRGCIGAFLDVTERRRAQEQERRYAERLRTLHEMDRTILSALSAPEMAQAVLEQLPRLVPCVHASAVLCDLPEREMTLLAVYAHGQTAPGDWHGPIDPAWEELFARLADGEAYIVPDLQAESSPSPRDEQLRAGGVRAHVYVPLRVQDRLIGSLDVGLPAPAPVPAELIESLYEVADQFAIGVEQARLYAEIERYAEDLERMVRRRTRALEISEARFRAIFEEAGLGVVLLNRKGRVITGNPALQRILGCSAEELHGRLLTDLLHPDDAPETTHRLAQLIAGEQPVYRAECRLRRADQTMADTSLTFSIVRPANSSSRLVVALVEDISERKRTQQALIQSDRLAITGRLAASLAHEIGNPLQSVVGCLELVNEVIADGESPGEYLTVAMDELDRAIRILNQMRGLNRRSDGQREPADMNDLLDKTLLVSKKQCQTHHVTVDRQAAQNLPLLPVIPDQIQSVFLNLVINAVDAMPDGGELRIHTQLTEAPHGVAVTFSDTGVGIPADTLSHLFEPFHTTKEQGLGLGLYVSHHIIDEHGGRIEVQSREGEGTTFVIWLPA